MLKPARKIVVRRNEAKRRAQDKLKCLRHYGGPIPRCNRCHICDVRFLVLDHINDDGYEMRRDQPIQGSRHYRWLIRNNFPESIQLQVLCYHCNLTKPNWNKFRKAGQPAGQPKK